MFMEYVILLLMTIKRVLARAKWLKKAN
jgi:hypothetical protein